MPSYWAAQTTWPGGYIPSDVKHGPKASKFIDTFSASKRDDKLTLLDVLGKTGTLESYIVAALLNNAAWKENPGTGVPDSVLTMATIQDMWNKVKGGEGYPVNAEIRWGESQVKTYLLSTMD